MNLAKQKILITGGTSGIGAALAAQLQSRGASVITCARSRPEHPLHGVVYYRCDLASPAERADLVSRIRNEHPDTSVLINNAAIQHPLDFIGGEAQSLQTTLAQELALNLEAPVALAAALLPLIAKQQQGAIVNITTALALAPKKSAPVYCAAKAGLHNFTRALRYQTETAAPHVKIQEIVPPLVATRMTDGRGSGKITPEEAAAAIIRAIENGTATNAISAKPACSNNCCASHRILPTVFCVTAKPRFSDGLKARQPESTDMEPIP
ncbi:SDR family NAD(P)-dependent oxidoreductase [Kingella potus]|uniref:SDR family NAD(P)-dependent oxidoreductase n=1 Tax=Kingella potus TaxID=265175 RepID=UPI001FD4E33E|nr:SDR family NAD(P)-dependent oxidoreductase [Kingella potus]UOP01266.1 SDR family NAD(P)-dependent oxidoreductase [Kingella potus]